MFNTLKVWDVITAFVKKDGFNPMNLRRKLAPGTQIPERVKRNGLKFDIRWVNRGTVATSRPSSEQNILFFVSRRYEGKSSALRS